MAEAKKAKNTAGAAPKATTPKAATPKAAASKAAPADAAAKAAAPKAKRTAAASAGPKVKVRLVRSGVGRPKDQRATLKGLGLSRINSESELLDSPALRGMLFKVRHLISVDGKPAA